MEMGGDPIIRVVAQGVTPDYGQLVAHIRV
jgi:hypothetical protein